MLKALFHPPILPQPLAPRLPVKWLSPTPWRVSKSFRPQRRLRLMPLKPLHKEANTPLSRALPSPVPKWPPNHPEEAWIICQAPNPSLPTATGPCRFLKTTHIVSASLLWHSPLKKNKPKQNKQNENSATMFCLDIHLTSHHVYRFPSKRSDLQITCISLMQPSFLSFIQLLSHPINLRIF